MASLPPKALHVLSALKQELLARPTGDSLQHLECDAGSRRPEPPGCEGDRALPRKAEVESRQRMRPAKRSKASIASRYYQRRESWTPVY